MLSRKTLGGFAALASALLLLSPLAANGEEPETDTLGDYKLLGPTGQNGYEMFASAPEPKAFAISPDGAWGVAFGADNIDVLADWLDMSSADVREGEDKGYLT